MASPLKTVTAALGCSTCATPTRRRPAGRAQLHHEVVWRQVVAPNRYRVSVKTDTGKTTVRILDERVSRSPMTMPSASWACSWKTCADSNAAMKRPLRRAFHCRSGKSVRQNKAAKACTLAALAKPGLRFGGRGGRSSVMAGAEPASAALAGAEAASTAGAAEAAAGGAGAVSSAFLPQSGQGPPARPGKPKRSTYSYLSSKD